MRTALTLAAVFCAGGAAATAILTVEAINTRRGLRSILLNGAIALASTIAAALLIGAAASPEF